MTSPVNTSTPVTMTCLAWNPECTTRVCDYPNAASTDCVLKARSDTPFFIHSFDQGGKRMLCALTEGKVYGENEATRDKCNFDKMNSLVVSELLLCPSGQISILHPDQSIECMPRPKAPDDVAVPTGRSLYQ